MIYADKPCDGCRSHKCTCLKTPSWEQSRKLGLRFRYPATATRIVTYPWGIKSTTYLAVGFAEESAILAALARAGIYAHTDRTVAIGSNRDNLCYLDSYPHSLRMLMNSFANYANLPKCSRPRHRIARALARIHRTPAPQWWEHEGDASMHYYRMLRTIYECPAWEALQRMNTIRATNPLPMMQDI